MCSGANSWIIASYRGTTETNCFVLLCVFALFLKYLMRKGGCVIWVGSVSITLSLAKLICVSVPDLLGDTMFQIRQMSFEESKGAKMLKNLSPSPSIAQRSQVFKSQVWKGRTQVNDFSWIVFIKLDKRSLLKGWRCLILGLKMCLSAQWRVYSQGKI